MAILAFQKPEKVIMLESTSSFGKFEFRPLEPGFGMTVGNALRRILLSSLEGYAITTVKVAGVDHGVHICGFQAVQGADAQILIRKLGLQQLAHVEYILIELFGTVGIAPTRAAARQLVSHCHICVNGSVVNIPSYSLRAGDVVSVREKSKSLEVISASLAGGSKSRYAWLEWDNASMSGKFLQKPEREEIPENIKEQLIVELYSK